MASPLVPAVLPVGWGGSGGCCHLAFGRGVAHRSDLTGPGKLSIWNAFHSRRQSKHLVPQFPFSLPTTPLGDARHLFHHFFIFFPYHLAELWLLLSFLPSRVPFTVSLPSCLLLALTGIFLWLCVVPDPVIYHPELAGSPCPEDFLSRSWSSLVALGDCHRRPWKSRLYGPSSAPAPHPAHGSSRQLCARVWCFGRVQGLEAHSDSLRHCWQDVWDRTCGERPLGSSLLSTAAWWSLRCHTIFSCP